MSADPEYQVTPCGGLEDVLDDWGGGFVSYIHGKVNRLERKFG